MNLSALYSFVDRFFILQDLRVLASLNIFTIKSVQYKTHVNFASLLPYFLGDIHGHCQRMCR